MDRYTKDYLNYIKETKDIDMSEQYELFMKYVPKGSKILDAGFGSGRDIAFFKQHYDVTGIDLSSEFVSYVKENIHPNVHQMDILNLKFDEKFDAIWACASLVHFDLQETIHALNQFHKLLIQPSILYVSLKQNEGSIILSNREYQLDNFLDSISFSFNLIDLLSNSSHHNKQSWFSLILEAKK
jgi:SAM-dependent methyltransferase